MRIKNRGTHSPTSPMKRKTEPKTTGRAPGKSDSGTAAPETTPAISPTTQNTTRADIVLKISWDLIATHEIIKGRRDSPKL